LRSTPLIPTLFVYLPQINKFPLVPHANAVWLL
jgi:hypothetical protein